MLDSFTELVNFTVGGYSFKRGDVISWNETPKVVLGFLWTHIGEPYTTEMVPNSPVSSGENLLDLLRRHNSNLVKCYKKGNIPCS